MLKSPGLMEKRIHAFPIEEILSVPTSLFNAFMVTVAPFALPQPFAIFCCDLSPTLLPDASMFEWAGRGAGSLLVLVSSLSLLSTFAETTANVFFEMWPIGGLSAHERDVALNTIQKLVVFV